MLSGIVNADLGNVADAVISYAQALRLAQNMSDASGEMSVLVNLGAALNYGGLYREAIPCLLRVVSLAKIDSVAEACVDPIYTARAMECAALNNLAQSYHYLGEFDAGYEAITECLRRSPPAADAIAANSLAIREYTAVELALELGKLDAAQQHNRNCQHYGSLGGSRASFLAQLSHGLCEVYGGNRDLGLRLLEALLDSGLDADAARIAVFRALIRAYEQSGAPEQALDYLTQLLDLTKSRRDQGFAALITAPMQASQLGTSRKDHDDLVALKFKHAELRVKVAENEAINSRIEMFERLAVAADLREEVSGEHGYRVGKLSALLARQLKWDRDACFGIELAARLHDIGKIGVPDRILLGLQELKDAERHFMNRHTVIGAEMLSKSNVKQLSIAEQIALCHHEWWNGEGYPSKLKGSRIPVHARIVALADVFDALTHGRPYAEAWSIDGALAEIRNRRGTQFDPDLTDLFIGLIDRLRKEHPDLDAYLGKAGRESPLLQARDKIRSMLASEREHERAAAVTGNETRH